MSEKKINRRVVREKCLQALYAFEINGEGLDNTVEALLSDVEAEKDRKFGERLIYKVVAEREELDKFIKSKVTNWEMDRIALIDRILLRMAIAEFLFFEDIPPKVSINEAIEIAKEFSTAKSGKFINGILDSVLSELKKKNKLKKTGRGLVEESLPKKSIEK